MRIDLHAHTTASDGAFTPTGLVDHAAEQGVDVVAVTDHDTVAGCAEAAIAAAGTGVRVVAGIEVSAWQDGMGVHVVGLFVDTADPAFLERLDAFRRERAERARLMVERLNALGLTLSFEDVLAQAGDAVLARPHVARALVASGLVPDIRAAFSDDLLGDGGPAHVPRDGTSPSQAVDLIRSAGGVGVLAHPGCGRSRDGRAGIPDDVVEALAAGGLAGIEVDHPQHPPPVRERLRAMADRLGLVPVGSSDCHGPRDDRGARLGTCTTDPEAFAMLRSLRPARRG